MAGRRGRGRGRPRKEDDVLYGAIGHFAPMGYPEARIRSTVEQLIEVFGKEGLKFLKEDHYRVVQYALFEKQEQEDPNMEQGDQLYPLHEEETKISMLYTKSDVDQGPTKKRFQQTVRCSLGEVLEAAKLLKDCHREKVRQAGFGCVFGWVLEGNVSRVLMCHLLMNIDTSTMKIQCGSGKVLDVNREAVHQIFGFPMGGDTVPKPADSGHDESLGILKKELGFENNASIETKEMRKLLATLVEDPEKIDLAVKVFFAILFNKLICPGSAVRIGREAPMLVGMDYTKMANMDFCQLIVDELKRAADKYQDRTIPQAGPEGCGVVPTVMYLDSCHSVNFSVMHTLTPRANFLHEKTLRDIYHLDMLKNGGSELSQYKFGKLGWKGRNQITYSYRLPVEELCIDPNVRSPVRSSDFDSNPVPLATSQPKLLVTQAPAANTGSNPQATSNSGASTHVSVIDEIGQLMQKVEDLSRAIPTTSDRMSMIAGLFPPGRGPSAESVRRETQHEIKLLDSLRLAASFVRTGFSEFAKKQDSLFTQYERESSMLGRENTAAEAEFFPDTGLGKSAAHAEEAAMSQAPVESGMPILEVHKEISAEAKLAVEGADLMLIYCPTPEATMPRPAATGTSRARRPCYGWISESESDSDYEEYLASR